MQIVIEIDEEYFEIMKHNVAVKNPLCPLSQEEMVVTVAKGTPLPKGHGKLIDENNLIKEIEDDIVGNYFDMRDWIRSSETIIKADKSESEK